MERLWNLNHVNVGASAVVGSYALTITGTSGALIRTAVVTLNVTPVVIRTAYGGYLGGQYNPLFGLADPTVGRPTNETTDFYDHTLRPVGEPHLPSLSATVTVICRLAISCAIDLVNPIRPALEAA